MNMAENEDENLIAEFEKAPENGFRLIYQRYSGPLFRFIYRFTGNRESAEELLQEVFSELLSGKYKTQENSQLKDWLYTLSKNKSLNFKKKSSYEVLNSEAIEEAIDGFSFEKQTIEQNLLKKLSLVEKSLPQELFQTWELRKQGHDYQSIGEKLSIPVGTVKSRFHRIVELIRKEID